MGIGIIAAIVGGLLLLGVGAWVLSRPSKQLPPPPAVLPKERDAAAPRDILEDRPELSGPVTVTSEMSLREIKAARRARLTDEYKASDVSEFEKERRRSGGSAGEVSPPSETAAPARVPDTDAVRAVDRADGVLMDGASAPTDDRTAVDTKASEAPGVVRATAGDDTLDLADAQAGQPPVESAQDDDGAGEPTIVDPAAAGADGAGGSEVSEETARSLQEGLEKTRSGFFGRLGELFRSKPILDDSIVEQLEEVLFTADIGSSTAQRLLGAVEARIAAGGADEASVWAVLRSEIEAILNAHARPLVFETDAPPHVVLVVGVNGAGKTTTIGKLAAQLMASGKSVMMVAGDTFRAAAVQQLEAWADRVGCSFHRGEDEADPSSVIFDGIESARSAGVDVVLCDTAGRLHTRTPLVDELKKIARVTAKAHAGAPHETVLVLDANTGQNAIQQARLFHQAVEVSGMVLTKLDGTARGGVVVGISEELQLPVYYIGIGEGVADLRAFDTAEFVDALF